MSEPPKLTEPQYVKGLGPNNEVEVMHDLTSPVPLLALRLTSYDNGKRQQMGLRFPRMSVREFREELPAALLKLLTKHRCAQTERGARCTEFVEHHKDHDYHGGPFA